MEHRLLRYFVVVAEELHFGRAAERLHLAQQPLSAAIKRLETRLGVQLLERTSRRVALTPAGEVYLEAAQDILHRTAAAAEAARRAARGQRGQLRVGYKPGALRTVLPDAVREFRAHWPAVDLQLRELEYLRVEAALSAGEVEVGLLCPELSDPALTCDHVHREPLVVILPRGHALAGRAPLPLAALSGETLVRCHRPVDALPAGMQLYDAISELCAASGFNAASTQEVASEDAVASLVAAGLGVGLVSASFARTVADTVEVRPLDGPGIDVDLIVAWHTSDASPVTADFVTFVRAAGQRATLELAGSRL
ncbi:LysR substrate-binding domain-containing protein [Deinococcus yunweiensis]|uniref:LysR substrate-binding domain-containing protein n=1 Tax=Deinococcus yunweiensis TaxID=367282 RepID=UPI00398EB4E2